MWLPYQIVLGNHKGLPLHFKCMLYRKNIEDETWNRRTKAKTCQHQNSSRKELQTSEIGAGEPLSECIRIAVIDTQNWKVIWTGAVVSDININNNFEKLINKSIKNLDQLQIFQP